MAERSKDEMARALEQLAGGHAQEQPQPDIRPTRPAAPSPKPRPAGRHATSAGGSPTPTRPAEVHATAEDDDAVIVPAPDASVFLHARKPPVRSTAKTPWTRSLGFRRTIIPMLLTGGLILIALGVLHFTWAGPLEGLPPWLVGLLFLTGVLLWGLAAANMIVVKHMLDASGR